MKLVIIKCEACEQKFEHFTRKPSSRKRFCDECIMRKQRVIGLRYAQQVRDKALAKK